MPKQITTTVYTLDELKELGDDNAVEAAREWVREGQCTDRHWYAYTLELWKDALARIGFENADIEFSGFGRGDEADFSARVNVEKLVAFFAAEIEPSDRITGDPEDFRPWVVSKLGGKRTTDKYRRLALVADHLIVKVGRTYSHYNQFTTEQPYRNAPAINRLLDDLQEDGEELRKQLCDAIYKSLEADYESEMSDETVDEVAEANEYTFTKTGKRYG